MTLFEPENVGLTHYMKKAFMWRWNLLAFGGAMAAAAISGAAGIAIPLVLAAEITFLGALGTNEKFQKAIAAQDHKEDRQALEEAPPAPPKKSREQRALDSLGPKARDRFEELKERCVQMRLVASGIRGDDGIPENDLHAESLNKMLWVFLRLLKYEEGMDQYLYVTDRKEIESRVLDLRQRADKATSPKIKRSLEDSVKTAELRMENYRAAQENREFIEIELDRIEDKIRALVEMAISHEDPDYISSQLGSVVESGETAMREMSIIPEVNDGMDDEEEDAPLTLLSA